ncbi:MAG: C1 family peptidase [Bacteroidota bacterium]|nr:C1 family peptidase [Bacteroidota bacterium]MDP4251098.1 C1 family peptidase [Bacteroidota bacterium]
MPIRMTDDPEQQDESGGGFEGGGGSGGGSGGGNGLFGLLPLLFGLVRGPKSFLLLLVLGAGAYFFFGRGGGCNSSGIVQQVQQLATGGILDPRVFDKAKVYESLSDDDSRNPLPESANLQKYAPPVGDQGKQGSCVAWSSAYGARTILESARTGKAPDELKFSPAFLYNQIGEDGCDGSYINRAMEFMTQRGSVPYEDFPYNDQDCKRQPDQQLLQQAQQFRMRGANRLTVGEGTGQIDLRAIKENLSQGAPVVIGMMVGGTYMQPMMGQDVWNPTQDDASMMGFGGHAQCVVGYDDTKYGGAFLIMNSWGPQWGNNGFAWVRYKHFKYFVREAYGLEPMQAVGAAADKPFECEVGLVEVKFDGKKTIAGEYIPLKLSGGNVFETIAPVKPGTRFKMEIRNMSECYIYVFGRETDGSSYTLFPYPRTDDPSKTKYSPFCGITGYRLFPKDKSMTPDSIGTKDVMAVVVCKDSLNWYEINKKISQNPGSDYAGRLRAALGTTGTQGVEVSSSAKGNIRFAADGQHDRLVACLVEIDK